MKTLASYFRSFYFILLFFTVTTQSMQQPYQSTEQPCYYELLPTEIKLEIIKMWFLASSNNMKEAINTLRVTSIIYGVRYDKLFGNLAGFTRLVHMLGKKFNKSTAIIALTLKTPLTSQYLTLGSTIRSDIITGTLDQITQLIKQGADVNFNTDSNLYTPEFITLNADSYDNDTPLDIAVTHLLPDKVKLLLSAGAIPKSNYEEYAPSQNWSKESKENEQKYKEEIKQLLENARQKK